jgi:hypothetical protein
LTPSVIVERKDADLLDPGDTGECRFDFSWVNIHPTGDDEIVTATRQIEQAISIEFAKVDNGAGTSPPSISSRCFIAKIQKSSEVGNVAPNRADVALQDRTGRSP